MYFWIKSLDRLYSVIHNLFRNAYKTIMLKNHSSFAYKCVKIYLLYYKLSLFKCLIQMQIYNLNKNYYSKSCFNWETNFIMTSFYILIYCYLHSLYILFIFFNLIYIANNVYCNVEIKHNLYLYLFYMSSYRGFYSQQCHIDTTKKLARYWIITYLISVINTWLCVT